MDSKVKSPSPRDERGRFIKLPAAGIHPEEVVIMPAIQRKELDLGAPFQPLNQDQVGTLHHFRDPHSNRLEPVGQSLQQPSNESPLLRGFRNAVLITLAFLVVLVAWAMFSPAHGAESREAIFRAKCEARMVVLAILAKAEEQGMDMTLQENIDRISNYAMSQIQDQVPDYLGLMSSQIVISNCRSLWLDQGPTVTRTRKTSPA